MRLLIGAIGLAAFLFFGHYGFADVIVDNGQTDVIFKVDGKASSPSDANKAAQAGRKVTKCSPVKNKNYVTKDGESIAGAVYNCREVDLVVSAKTGASHWKNK